MKIGVYGRLFLVVLGIITGLLLVHFRLTLLHLAALADEIDQRAYLEVARDLRGSLDSIITSDLRFAPGGAATLERVHRANADLELYLVGSDGEVLDRFPRTAPLVRVATAPLETMLTSLEPPLPLRLAGDSAAGKEGAFSVARLTTRDRAGYLLVRFSPAVSVEVRSRALIGRVLHGLATGFVLTAAVGLAVVGLTVWLLSRQFRALLHGIDAYRRGSPEQVPILGTGEASYLARRYNHMITQLEDRRAELVRIEQSRRALVANLVHDLRTPLGAVQGFLGLLLMKNAEPDPERRAHFIRTAHRSGLAHRSLLESLSELAALDAQERAPLFEPHRVDEIADAVVQRIGPRAAEKSITLTLAVRGQPPLIPLDSGMIERVLTNFLTNAVRYTPAGGAAVVEISPEVGGVRVAITDTGIGIPEEKQPHIFDEFYRAHKGLPEDAGGTGLGLGIVKRILALHGSVPELESKVGEGTRFSFVLREDPVAAAAAMGTAEEKQQAPPSAESRAEPELPPGPALILRASLLVFSAIIAMGYFLIPGYQVPWLYLLILTSACGLEQGSRRLTFLPLRVRRCAALAAVAAWGGASGMYIPLELAARDFDARTIYETALLYWVPLSALVMPRIMRSERVSFAGSFALGAVWTYRSIWRTELIALGTFVGLVGAAFTALSVRRDTLAMRLGAAFVGVVAMIGFFQGYQSAQIWSSEIGRYEQDRGARLLAPSLEALSRELCAEGADPPHLLRGAGALMPTQRLAVVRLPRTEAPVTGEQLISGGVFYGIDEPLDILDPLPSAGVPELLRVTRSRTVHSRGALISPPLCGNVRERLVGFPRSHFSAVLERQLAEKHVIDYLFASSAQTVILAALLGVGLLVGVSRRIKIAARTAERWEAGFLSERVPDLGDDEVGQLGIQLNGLAEETEREHGRVRQADEQRRLFVEAVASGLGPPCERTVTALAALQEEAERHVEPDPKVVRALAREVTSQIRLVNDLFDFSKIETERRPPEAELFSLAEVASDTASELTPRALERGVRLELAVSGGQVPAFGDIGMVSRSMELLLGAAVERAAAGEVVRLTVSPGAAVNGAPENAAIAITYAPAVHASAMPRPAVEKSGRDADTADRATLLRAGPGSIELYVGAHLLERTGGRAVLTEGALTCTIPALPGP